MSDPKPAEQKCQQKGCTNEACAKMYWPSRPAAPICLTHAAKAQQIADAMGFHLVIEELR